MPEIRTRITNANRANYTLLPVLKSQSVLGTEKIKSLLAINKNVTSYGAQSWIMSKGIVKWLATLKENI